MHYVTDTAECQVGDLVVVYPWIPGCNLICNACRKGDQSDCSSKNILHNFIRFHLDGG